MVVFVLLAIVVWQWRIGALEDTQRKEVSEIIHNVVQEQANKNLLLPQIVIINADSSQKKELSKQLIDEISTVLSKKYLTNDTTNFSNLELKPFYVLPNKPNKSGTYSLTETQISDLKNHLDFLTKQVDVEIDKAKEEVGRDIDRLNLWVTIWIGVIGFLGIFIPIIINIDTSKSAEKATEKSESAFTKSHEAITKIDNAQTEIAKIEGIETRIGAAEGRLGGIETKADAADAKSDEAKTKADDAAIKAKDALVKTEKTENILSAINAIGSLKDIDINTLQYITKPMSVLIKTLCSIYAGLLNCNNQTDHPIVKDCLRQLGVRLQILTFFKFIKHDNTELINNFSGVVSDKLNNNYSKQNFDAILVELKNLTDNLKND